MASNPTIAFFGATGGCTCTALALSLEAGYTCTALARTPSKLTSALLARGIPQSTLDAHLTITPGDIRDSTAVREVLKVPHSSGGVNVDIILSGIGNAPDLMNLANFDKTLCTDAAKTILAALSDSGNADKKPLFIAISTTGVTTTTRDVPLLMIPLYHLVLAAPHADKRGMEVCMLAEIAKPESQRAIAGIVAVRPSLLTNGKRAGTEKIRAGVDGKPAVGYTISRDDVGGWIFEELLAGRGKGRTEWVDKMVTITY
ncbi:MAG: hypothetical protein M1827_001876 [Pycnora praestabilis]|nr:MAG: hypothetical protein M1827_001876 [Pycnora praestabilis]